jgi:hypothetical protein
MDLPNVYGTPFLPKNLSADGNRFFFQTPDPLVPADVNARSGCAVGAETATCLDVYEWEAEGSGSCKEAVVSGGCIYLLSSGKEAQASYFADADPEGKNAFIFTAARLTPSDRDEAYDVYDVREGGGFATQNQGEPPLPCRSQQACQGPGTTSPEAPTTPGSSTLVAPGNPKPGCGKGAARKHGRCVKKNAKKHKKHSKRTAKHGKGGRK